MKLYEYVLRIKDQFSDNFQRLSRAAGRSSRRVDRLRREMDDAGRSARSFGGSLRGVGVGLTALFAGVQVMAFGQDVLRTTTKMEGLGNAIAFASGGAEQGAKSMAFLDDLTDKLGLDYLAAADGFKTFSSALLGTNIEIEQGRKIFSQVSTAVTALNMTADESKGVFRALGQIMSKGKVQAEELRGQLGERLSGAFYIAAESMGYSVQEMDKMMATGKVMAEEFIPRFAAQIQKTFAGALPKAVNSLQANLNKFNKEVLLLKYELGLALLPAITAVVTGLREMFSALRSALGFMKEHAGTVKAMAVGIGVATVAWGAYALATNAAAIGTAVVNAVMAANPIGLVVIAVGALVAAFIDLYNKSEKFRRHMNGVWATVKEVFLSIADLAVKIFGGLWDVVSGLWERDLDKAKKGLKSMAEGILASTPLGFARTYGKNIANAAVEGFQDKMNHLPSWMQGAFGAIGKQGPSFTEIYGGPFAKTKAEREAEKLAEISANSSDDLKEGIDTIAGGGGRAVNVNVSLGKFVETINYNSSVAESADDVVSQFREMLARVINGGVYSATQ